MFQQEDYMRVVDALPTRVKNQLIEHTDQVVLAGGFIRDTLLNLAPSDVDVFCKTEELACRLAYEENHGIGVVRSDCSYTTLVGGAKVQYVYCRIFTTAYSLIDEFDFTCCGVSAQYLNQWSFDAVNEFDDDTINRKLVFRCAEYNRGNLGALTRAFKFVAKGWFIPQNEISKIVHHYIQPNFRRRTDNQTNVNVSTYGQNRSEAGRQVERSIERLESSRTGRVVSFDGRVVSFDYGEQEARIVANANDSALRGTDVSWLSLNELSRPDALSALNNDRLSAWYNYSGENEGVSFDTWNASVPDAPSTPETFQFVPRPVQDSVDDVSLREIQQAVNPLYNARSRGVDNGQ